MLSVFEPGCFNGPPLVSQFGVDPCAGTAEIGRHWHAPCTGIVAGGFQGPAGKQSRPSDHTPLGGFGVFLTSLPDFNGIDRSGPARGACRGRSRSVAPCGGEAHPTVPNGRRAIGSRRVDAPKISGNAAEDRLRRGAEMEGGPAPDDQPAATTPDLINAPRRRRSSAAFLNFRASGPAVEPMARRAIWKQSGAPRRARPTI